MRAATVTLRADASLQDIRLFVAVYEERSFTRAAEREHATQSGVSQHVRKLETRYGVRLFERGANAVVPTPAGDRFYRSSIDVLRRYIAADRELRQHGRGLEGTVSVGLMPSMTRCILAPALVRFMEAHPNVSVHTFEAYSRVLAERVMAGELDFAVVPALESAVGLRGRLLLRTPETIALKAGSGRLRHLAPTRLADLGPLKVVVPGIANARRRSLDAYFAACGAEIVQILELDAMLATLDFVERTDWVAILPGVLTAPDIDGQRLSIAPLTDPPLWLDLVLIEPLRRPMSPAAEAFLEVLSEESARVNRVWLDVVAETAR
jgi:LysR family nitrogen assimilation transcriptional regulator